LLVGDDVQSAEEIGQAALARGIEAGEAQKQSEGQTVVAAELGDRFQAAHARQEGDRGEVEQRWQRMSAAAWLARVGKGSEDVV